MPNFAYQGRNAQGKTVKGVIEGGSASAVADYLFNSGITPINISASSQETAAEKEGTIPGLGGGRITLVDVIFLCRQLYTLTKAGVPILRALAGLRDSTPNRALARVLSGVRENLEAGRELSVAIARYPKVFSPLFLNLVRVGEMTGRLEEVFLRLAEYYGFEKYIREKIKAAVRYPIFVLTAMVAAIVVVNIFVIPVFAKMFSSFGAQLPLMTRILIGTSEIFVQYWPMMLIVAAAAIFTARLWIATPPGRYVWDRMKLRLPIAGPLIHKATMARFARAFALTGKSGVPIVQALAVVGEVVENVFVRGRVEKMREGIERGESILVTATATGVFNPVVLQMIAVGEETGEIDSLMQEIAEMYERDVEFEIEALASRIEPILLVFIGAMVLVLALGIFLPMWDMVSAVRGGKR